VGTEDGVDRLATKGHIAYEISDLAEMRRRLAEAGVEMIDSIPIPGHDRFELRDPFGNRVEIIQLHAAPLPPAARVEVPACISTDRLDIRRPILETLDRDAAEVNAAIVESIEQLRPWMKWATPTPTLQQTRENLRRAIESWTLRRELRLLLFLKGTQTLVGSSGLHGLEWDIPRFEIGYWGRTRFCGNGYVTEAVRAIRDVAFDALGARRVEIRTSGCNERSIRVAERAGFDLEAVLRRDERQIDGTLRDTHIYALTR
jgi:RimJ/RimL family protein N-acetyltransferase